MYSTDNRRKLQIEMKEKDKGTLKRKMATKKNRMEYGETIRETYTNYAVEKMVEHIPRACKKN